MSAQQPSRVDENAILFAAIDSIIPNPRQPRRIFRDDDPQLLELSDSIRTHGLLQPIVVTRLNSQAITKETRRDDASWFTDDELPSSTSAEVTNAVQYQIIAGER